MESIRRCALGALKRNSGQVSVPLPTRGRAQVMFAVQHACFATNSYFPSTGITVNSMRDLKNPGDILGNLSSCGDSSAQILEAALRSLGYCRLRGDEADSLYSDERFQQLLINLKGRLSDMDTRLLGMVANALSLFTKRSSDLEDLAQKIADVAIRRENSFHPRALSTLVAALPRLGVKDPAVAEFFRLEAVKVIPDTTPADLHLLLDGFRLWGQMNKELVDMICEKMSDEIDRYTSKDVCDTLEVLSAGGLARGFLIRRLSSLAFENLNQFTTKRLVSLLYSLSKLRFLSPDNYVDVLDIIRQNSAELYGPYIAKLCYALTLGNCKMQEDYVVQLLNQTKDSAAQLGLESCVKLAYTVLYFELTGFDSFLKDLLGRVFDARTERLTPECAIMLAEAVNCLEIERPDLGVIVPPSVMAFLDEKSRAISERLEQSRLHLEIASILGTLKGKYKLDVQRGLKAGPYFVDMLDEESKIVVELDTLLRKTNGFVKMRHLEKLGYRPILVPFWQWRRCRSEADQINMMKHGLEKHVIALGRTEGEAVLAAAN